MMKVFAEKKEKELKLVERTKALYEGSNVRWKLVERLEVLPRDCQERGEQVRLISSC